MKKIKIYTSVLCTLLFMTGYTSLFAQKIYYNGSAQISSGSYYFSETSQSIYLNNGISISFSKFNVSADFVYIFQNSPWISYTSVGGLATGGPENESVSGNIGKGQGGKRREPVVLPDTSSYTRSGLGDPTLGFRYNIFEANNAKTIVSLSSTVKFPLADSENGFGTGALDYSFGAGLYQNLGSWFLGGSASYWHFGNMDELELQDALSYGASLGRSLFNNKWMVLYTIGGMTEIIDGTDPPLSSGIGISYRISQRSSVNSSALFSHSESSADYSIGIGWFVDLTY